ncbi:MAG: hypothetical protein Q9169_007488 [Polycauliona sp. 2 TL-2023]
MPLRLAQRRDLPTIASIYAAAFWNEEVQGQLMHPYRQEHPQDFLRFWTHKVEEWYWSYRHQMIVSYETKQTSDGNEEQMLTGVADWIRHGDGWEHLWGVWGWWDPHFQNQRIGSNLAKWGIERATEENVTASVISSVGRDPFYRRCGFNVEVGNATDGEDNPLRGKVDGGTILFRDIEADE